MSKFLVETHYTCTFKIIHELDELNEKSLSEVDNRKDGKVEIVNVTVNNRKSEIKIVKMPINSTASRHPSMPTKYVSGEAPIKVPKDPMPKNVAASVAKIFGE